MRGRAGAGGGLEGQVLDELCRRDGPFDSFADPAVPSPIWPLPPCVSLLPTFSVAKEKQSSPVLPPPAQAPLFPVPVMSVSPHGK